MMKRISNIISLRILLISTQRIGTIFSTRSAKNISHIFNSCCETARNIQLFNYLYGEQTREEIESISPDGIFLSNGPGDPSTMDEMVTLVREFLSESVPFFCICFGHQILGRALGFTTYKLPFGHRGINQPVKNLRDGTVEITAHNHGFAVNAPVDANFTTVFGAGFVSHICLNDGVVEGLELLERPAFSVQYHPESAAGPHDAAYLFDHFAELMTKKVAVHNA